MDPFRVILAPAARRQLDGVRGAALFALRGAILALADDLHPPGATKLSGRSDLWRVRLRVDGVPWRIVYQIDADARRIVITGVAAPAPFKWISHSMQARADLEDKEQMRRALEDP